MDNPKTVYMWICTYSSPCGACCSFPTGAYSVHTNIIKPDVQGNKGHLIHRHTICHSNLDYEVSCETPNMGQGHVSEPSEWCKCVGICVSGE